MDILYNTLTPSVFLAGYSIMEAKNGREDAIEIFQEFGEDTVSDILEKDEEHLNFDQDKVYKKASGLVLNPYRAGRYAELKEKLNNK